MERAWGAQTLNNKPEEYSSSTEREARSIALEKAYVHDVYSQIASHFSDSRYRAWPKVKQFLLELEPGSIVCDVGCGNGKYLDINPSIYKIGIDRCSNLAGAAREKNHEVLISDNLNIPFRDDCFDAVISIAVIHHFATTERRVAALKELARVLRIGGRLMVSVWAMEQRHRRFESQDVLVPWSRPMNSSSDDKTSSIERDLNSTTTTTSNDDDDAATHYHAYTQTSDSDHSFPSHSLGCRKRGRIRHRSAIDPTCPSSSQSSSDLSSPNESCYTFVRRALQKLAGTRRNRGGRRPWFLQGLDIPDDEDHFASLEEDLDFRNNLANQQMNNFMPIELHQLESTDFVELLQLTNDGRPKPKPGMLFSNVLYPRRRRTLETTSEIQHSGSIAAQPKSKSLSDLFGLIPAGILRTHRQSTEELSKKKKQQAPVQDVTSSTSSLSAGMYSSNDDERQFPDCVRHKAVQTESAESLDRQSSSRPSSEIIGNLFITPAQFPPTCGPCSASVASLEQDSLDSNNGKKLRPLLVKQKQSISISPSSAAVAEEGGGGVEQQEGQNGGCSPSPVCWGELKKSVRDLPELRGPNTLQVPSTRGGSLLGASSSFWKQSSLNDELIFSERLQEKQLLKQNIQKQCSLNEELIYKRRENTRWDQMKEAFLNSPNVKCLQLIKNGISNRFRGSTESGMQCSGEHLSTSTSNGSSPSPTQPRQSSTHQAPSTSTSIRNGIVRMLQNWKQGDQDTSPTHGGGANGGGGGFGGRRGSKEGTQRRGLFPPFFLRRSSAGSLNVSKDPLLASSKVLSPPHLMKRPSENELLHDALNNGNKLIPGVRHIRKLSREEGSDSSKDSSFQSDTSVDSEDSFASVIFIPNKTSMEGDAFTFNTETRANSTDSDRSPKSPASRLSPPNHNLPKSPSPLANELLRRRSPEVSPTKMGLYGSASTSYKEVTKFVFDENATKLLSPGLASTSLTCELPSTPKEDMAAAPTQDVSVSVPEMFQQEKQKDFNAPSTTSTTSQLPANIASVHQVQPKRKVEKIEVLRKPGVLPEGNKVTRQLVRRSLPKSLAVELFNPETDDADTSDTSSSSPNSVSSVVSVVNEDNSVSWSVGDGNNASSVTIPAQAITQEASEKTEEPPPPAEFFQPTAEPLPCIQEEVKTETYTSSAKAKPESRKSSSASLLETAASVVSSLENLVSQSSPKARRKLTLAKLGSTSEWLSSLPCDFASGGHSVGAQGQHSTQPPPPLVKRSSLERRNAGEKLLLGDVKKYQQKGPDAKWPCSLIDDSPPHSASNGCDTSFGKSLEDMAPLPDHNQSAAEMSAKLLEEMEEGDSLFDSLENLSNSRQHPSRNPSIDSSVRMSSTCSCSIRGGESFESWSSAKSSLTNSSSTHPQHKASLPSIIPLAQTHSASGRSISTAGAGGGGGHAGGKVRYQGTSSKSSSAAGEDTENSAAENSTALTYHRYYHVFREGELDKLIEKYVQNLHIISSYYDHANWCIILEKVQVWTI